jgi:hypothetical protein
MGERKRPAREEIERRLLIARNGANFLPERRVREWACEYLRRHAAEAQEDPEDAPDPSKPHWNLLMQDGAEPGFFVAIVFHPKPRGLELAVGTGASYCVRSYCEHEARADAEGLWEALRGRFNVPRAPLRLSRAAARDWLGCEW